MVIFLFVTLFWKLHKWNYILVYYFTHLTQFIWLYLCWWFWHWPSGLLSCFSSYSHEIWAIYTILHTYSNHMVIYYLLVTLTLTYCLVFEAILMNLNNLTSFSVDDLDLDKLTYFLVFEATLIKFQTLHSNLCFWLNIRQYFY